MTTRRSRRQAAQGRDEMLGMVVSCIGGAAILAFVSPQLLLGPYGIALGTGVILFSVLAVWFHLRGSGSAAGALVLVLLTVSITAGSLYGLWWYLFVHVASQPSLFSIGSVGQPQANQPGSIVSTSSPVIGRDEVASAPTVAPSTSPGLARTCGRAVVQEVEALALRAAPTRNSPQLTAITRGNQVAMLCADPVYADERQWYHVRAGNLEGWMSARYLDVQQP